MARIPSLGVLHTIKVNDAAFFLIQKRIIEAREMGSTLKPSEIASNLIVNHKKE